ncbi:MAG TPA: translocation/assembly module TamB domain-containing protein [Microvirga sp.]|nr:translocation/assembly module TamB domain-containing protein [Microvirga sp.]
MSIRRTVLFPALAGLAVTLSALAWLGLSSSVLAQSETTILGDLISRALSTPTTRVSIGAVQGALTSDATIRNVTVSDSEGPWLRLDRARLIWRRAALFSRRLEVDRLEIGRLEILRRPPPGESAPGAADAPLLPELPLKVEVKAFSLAELSLGEPVLGAAARLTASGAAKLGPPAEGLDLTVEARRLDVANARLAARLLFVPQGEQLDLRVGHEEPAGGLVARLAGLPGLPPVRLDLTGRGVLDDWNATLALEAGDVGASGRARLAREGAERRLALDLEARLESVLPPAVAPVFAGTNRLTGTARFGDAGAVILDGLTLASRLVSVDIRGTLSPDRVVDATAVARALPSDPASGRRVTRAREAELESLVFNGSVQGPLRAPRIAGRLDAEGIRVPQGRLAKLSAQVAAEPDAAQGRFAVRADAAAEGVALAEPAQARAVGDRLSLVLRGVWGADGVGDVETLRLSAPALEASYAGRIGRSALAGRLTADLKDLSRFADLAARPGLGGAATLTAQVDGSPRERLRADLDANATRLTVGTPAADRLLGGRLAVQGRAEILSTEGGVAFQNLRAEAAHVTARIEGRAVPRSLDLGLQLSLADLARVDERLAGRAEADLRLTGSVEKADATGTLTAANARALGRPLRGVALTGTARDLTGALDAEFRVAGSIGDERLGGGLRLRRPQVATWSLEDVDLRVGSAAISGRVDLDAAGLAAGDLRLRAPDLDHLSPVVLMPLSGSLDADIGLSRGEPNRQDIRFAATGRRLGAGRNVTLAAFDANLSAADIYRRPVIDGRLTAERLVAGGQTFEQVRLAATGTPAASDVVVTATARGFALDGAARVLPGDETRVEIASLTARRGERRFALAQPASVTLEGRSARLSELAFTTNGGGRVSLAGRVGERLDLTVGVRALPLSVIEVARPDWNLAGSMDGEAVLTGTAARPEGRYRLSIAGLATAQTRAAGLPAIDMTASGALQAGGATVDGTLAAGRAAQLRATGRIPLASEGTLAVAIAGQIDPALANPALSTGGRRVTGRVGVDASLSGTPAAPRVEGSATLTGGTFTDPLQGIRLTGIEGRITGRGESVTIERLTANTRNGGRLGVTGRVSIDPAQGFPGALRIGADRAELVSNEVVTAVSNLALVLEGPLARSPRIAGRIDLISMDVSIPDRMPATSEPLPGTRHVGAPPHVRARLAAASKAQAARRARGAAPFDAALDLVVSAPNRIFVRGRGVDAELGGDLRLTGSSRQPVAIGAFDLRRGRLAVAGQRLDFTRGRLTFAGDLTPDLDLVAETRAGDVSARVAVSGPASQPTFALTSEPALPQDEILSRLLFAKASGNLSAFQALQLAQAVAQFSGRGGPDLFDRTRRALGVDSLDITTGASGGPAVAASRYIGDRISVGVRAGARPEDSAATVNVDVTRRVKVQGEVGADGRSSLGVGAEWEY